MARRAIIIGGGPAGLTAAWELLDRTGLRPVVLEASPQVGGLSRTVEHGGNRMDLGGHRFFSQSRRVMDWWLNILPLQGAPARDDVVLGRPPPDPAPAQRRLPGRPARPVGIPDPERDDPVMLTRPRLSRIYFLGQFFDYPLSLNGRTLAGLGATRTARIGASYLRARLRPPAREDSLEDFLIARFGRELYRTFFEGYTRKVWGLECRDIDSSWGAQRIRGLSLTRTLTHALKQILPGGPSSQQEGTESSLIDRFLYPKLGSGHLWEEVADQVEAAGGEVRRGWRVVGLERRGSRIERVVALDPSGRRRRLRGSLVLSSMPVPDLLQAIRPSAPAKVREVSGGLRFRSMVVVGMLLRRLRLSDPAAGRTVHGSVPDQWIYVQDEGVRLARIQFWNNWSPYLVADPTTAWLGLEYFCDEGDELWNQDDRSLADRALAELVQMGVADAGDRLDARVVRVPQAYPTYFGSYGQFGIVRGFLDGIDNLLPIGRNGMHRYNNQDHSMLAAMVAVDGIAAGDLDRRALWDVNADDGYHEA